MGAYDDIPTIPGSVGTTGGGGSGGGYDDLPSVTMDQIRRKKLREMALQQMKQQSGEPGASDIFSNAFTLYGMKPVSGLANAVSGEVNELFGIGNEQPATFGERYSAGTGAYQAYMDEARKKSGWGGTAADVAGSVTSGGPARNLLQQASTRLPELIGQNALLGGVEGAAENSEDLESAVTGGGRGALTAGGATGVLGHLFDYARGFLPGARAERAVEREISRGPDPNDIRQSSRDIYRVLDQGGVAYDATQSSDLADSIMRDLVHGPGGWDPQGAHSVLQGVIDRIEGQRGQPLSLETLQQIRSQAGANSVSTEPSVRNAAGRILSAIDGYVQNVNPAQSALPAGQDVGPLWTEARRLWRTANTIDDINWRVDKAGRRAASTNSGQNEENAIRQNIRGVVDKATQPGRFNPYTPAQITQMERVVRGTPAQNALRTAGNAMAGIPGSIASMGGAASTGLSGIVDPAASTAFTVAAPFLAQGAGYGLKRQAANIAQNEADSLVRLIATGSMDRLPIPPRQNIPTRASLARALAGQSLLRAGGKMGYQ